MGYESMSEQLGKSSKAVRGKIYREFGQGKKLNWKGRKIE